MMSIRKRMQRWRMLFLQQTAGEQLFRMILKQPLFSPPFIAICIFSVLIPGNLAFKGQDSLLANA
jgi:hypothetical protein